MNVYKLRYSIYRLGEGHVYYSPVMEYDLAYWQDNKIEILATDLTIGQVYSYINEEENVESTLVAEGSETKATSEPETEGNIEFASDGEFLADLISLVGQRRLTLAELASLVDRQAKARSAGVKQKAGVKRESASKKAGLGTGGPGRPDIEENSRKLLEAVQKLYLEGRISIRPAVYEDESGSLVCGRCLSSQGLTQHDCAACQSDCYYCVTCARYGETRTCLPLVEVLNNRVKANNKIADDSATDEKLPVKSESEFERQEEIVPIYPHPLTEEQLGVSKRILEIVQAGENGLVWAVTGAGKTEMVFAAIAWVLGQGQGPRVLVATPRKDVVMELLPRFRAAFPTVSLNAVYGGSDDKHEDASLIIASTHQLIRYRDQVFDLVVIDETDAFPYAGDELLYRHAHRVGKGQHVYMTATPDRDLLSSVPEANILTLFGRHHGQALPEPAWMQVPSLTARANPLDKFGKFIKTFAKRESKQRESKLSVGLIRALEQIPAGSIGMIFVPSINRGHWLHKLLGDYYGDNKRITFVYAADPDRMAKIQALRNREYDLVVTTTILERGVTIPDSHVIVVDAENPVFNKSTLIQIAGRVGRTVAYPSGVVLFLGKYLTDDIKSAITEIKSINKEYKNKSKGSKNGSSKSNSSKSNSGKQDRVDWQSKANSTNKLGASNLKAWLDEAANLFFPQLPACRICDKAVKVNKLPFEAVGQQALPQSLEYKVKGLLCDSCRESMVLIGDSYCQLCGRQMEGQADQSYCRDCQDNHGRDRHFQANRALLKYNDWSQEIIHRFKYYGDRGLADLLGIFLEEGLATYYPETKDSKVYKEDKTVTPNEQTINIKDGKRWDLIMPVPLHADRLAERGYNQADLLARPLAAKLGISYDEESLVRIRYTDKQSHRTRADRVRALENAFAISGDSQQSVNYRNSRLLGKKILLIDDIYTTGTTMDACAQVLIQAGAESVSCLTIAR